MPSGIGRSRPHFEDHAERGLGGAAEAGEAAREHDFAQALLAGLGAEREADGLALRCRGADHRRERVVHPSDGINTSSLN